MLKVPIDSLQNALVKFMNISFLKTHIVIAIAIFITSSIVVAILGESLHVCICYILCSYSYTQNGCRPHICIYTRRMYSEPNELSIQHHVYIFMQYVDSKLAKLRY